MTFTECENIARKRLFDHNYADSVLKFYMIGKNTSPRFLLQFSIIGGCMIHTLYGMSYDPSTKQFSFPLDTDNKYSFIKNLKDWYPVDSNVLSILDFHTKIFENSNDITTYSEVIFKSNLLMKQLKEVNEII